MQNPGFTESAFKLIFCWPGNGDGGAIICVYTGDSGEEASDIERISEYTNLVALRIVKGNAGEMQDIDMSIDMTEFKCAPSADSPSSLQAHAMVVCRWNAIRCRGQALKLHCPSQQWIA